MSKKHSWSAGKARAARSNFGLVQERHVPPNTASRTKPRNYLKRLCPLNHCFKEVKRIGNHLRQFHKLSNEKARKYTSKAVFALEDHADSETEDSCSSSETDSEEDEKVLQHYFSREIHRPNGDNFIYTSGDEDDSDWLGEKFFRSHAIKSRNKLENDKTADISEGADHIESSVGGRDGSDIENEGSDELSEVESMDDEDKDYEDLEDRFFMSSKEEDVFLNGFVDWLCSPDGGRKPRRTALQHKSVIMNIVRYKKDQQAHYPSLCDRSFLNMWMVKLQDEGRESGTIKTYLGSVLHLFNFVCITENNLFDFDQMKRMEAVVKQWRRNLWRSIKVRESQKQLIDMERFPTASEISRLDKSERIKEATQTLNRFMSTESKITRKDFCLVRDYILLYLIFDNASRPGAISNMTLKELNHAVCQKDGFVVRVVKHKTAYKGPANISISHDLHKHIHGYVKWLRNKLPGIRSEDDDPVFVSWGGTKMEANMITNQMNTLWGRIHGTRDRINPTLVRKYTTTTIHQNKPDMKKDTADLLCHSVRTAENSYVLIEKQNKAACTSRMIQSAQREQHKQEVTDEMIMKEFENEISIANVTMADVREKFMELDCFSKVRGDRKQEKRVLDLVRYRIKVEERNKKVLDSKDAKEHVENINVEEIESKCMEKVNFVAGQDHFDMKEMSNLLEVGKHAGESKRKRKAFSERDMELIRKYLGSYVNSDCSIIREEFENYLLSKSQLKPLVEKFGIRSLIVKMRTERKNR